MHLRFLPLLVLLISSCGAESKYSAESALAATEIAASGASLAESHKSSEESLSAHGRLIIRNGQLSIVVKETESTLAQLSGIADALGGWVVNSSTHQSGVAKRGVLDIRVPSTEFDHAMTTIREISLEVIREEQTGRDVTDQFVDFTARLSTAQSTAERVRGFLEETHNVEEALAVNKELGQLDEQVELLQGKIKFLAESAAFSRITISITPEELNQPIQIAGWRPSGVARNAIRSLLVTAQGLGNCLIWLTLYILPMVLLIGVPLYFLSKPLQRLQKARRSKKNHR